MTKNTSCNKRFDFFMNYKLCLSKIIFLKAQIRKKADFVGLRETTDGFCIQTYFFHVLTEIKKMCMHLHTV